MPGGPSVRALAQIARDFGVVVMAGLIERDPAGRLYNCYVTVGPDGFITKFRKLHTFISPYLSPGDSYNVIDLLGIKAGFLICYDNNLPENVRITTMLGAEVIFMPHVTGCLPSTMPGRGTVDRALWENRDRDPVRLRIEFEGPKGRGWLLRWLPARAWENGVYAVFSNPVGVDDDTIKPGLAMILDPYGEVRGGKPRAGRRRGGRPADGGEARRIFRPALSCGPAGPNSTASWSSPRPRAKNRSRIRAGKWHSQDKRGLDPLPRRRVPAPFFRITKSTLSYSGGKFPLNSASATGGTMKAKSNQTTLGLMTVHFFLAICFWAAPAFAQDFQFDSSMSRPVLENYLDRSISFTELLHDDLTQPRNRRGVDPRDNLRLILSSKAKFVGRALMVWGREKELAAFSRRRNPTPRRSIRPIPRSSCRPPRSRS